MAEAVLRVEHLTKNYGRVRALHDVSFEVAPGEVFGLLGPNGAGKTTLLRTLLDFIRPTSGGIEVFGRDSVRDSVAVRSRCAYLPGDFVVPARLTGYEAIARYTFARHDGAEAVAQRLADRIDLDLARRVGDLSKGNRQKVGLVLAFSTPADLLVLDEPTSGLDPLLQRTFRDLVRERQADGTAVLLSSHVLDEVEHLAQRVGVLRLGELMLIDTVAHLLDQASRALRLRFVDESAAAAAATELSSVPGVSSVVRDASTVQLRVTGSVDALIKALARHTTLSLDEVAGDLQDVFIALYASGEEGSA